MKALKMTKAGRGLVGRRVSIRKGPAPLRGTWVVSSVGERTYLLIRPTLPRVAREEWKGNVRFLRGNYEVAA